MNDNHSPANGIKIGNEKLIRVTENAAHRLSSLLEKQGRPQGALRLAVIGGGCSGLQYKMDLVEGPVSFVDTRNNKRDGNLQLKPVQTVVNGVPFGRPYQSPFAVR